MQTKQANILGIKYTLIFSIVHVFLFVMLPMFLDNSRDGRQFRKEFWNYADVIFPFMILCSWYFGRKFGKKVFINKAHRFNACYSAIFMTTSIPHLIIAFNIMLDDFNEISFNSVLGSLVLGAICVTAINMFPPMLTAMVMRWAVRSKQRKLNQVRSGN